MLNFLYQRRLRLIFRLFCLVFMIGNPVAASELVDRAREAGFSPHKALYEIKLAGTKSGSQIVNISGQMFYEWQPTCGAWTSNHRFNLFYEYADTPSMQIISDFSTYETFDGKSMNFTSQKKRDGHLFEEMRGQATIEENGTSKAVFTLPKDLVYDLPEGTLFPMMHSLRVVEAVKEGKKFYKSVIFDGSDQEGPVEINAFIGKGISPAPALSSAADIDATLIKSPARQVRLAFFPLNDPSATSDYEMNITFHENGVISDMLIEYDDFSVHQTLVALESLPDSCKSTGKQP